MSFPEHAEHRIVGTGIRGTFAEGRSVDWLLNSGERVKGPNSVPGKIGNATVGSGNGAIVDLCLSSQSAMRRPRKHPDVGDAICNDIGGASAEQDIGFDGALMQDEVLRTGQDAYDPSRCRCNAKAQSNTVSNSTYLWS